MVFATGSEFSLTPKSGSRSPITLKQGSFVLGSSQSTDIEVIGAKIAGEHSRIDVKSGRVFITDLDTEGGTFVDENKLFPGVAYILGSGSEIRLGDGSPDASFTIQLPVPPVSMMDELLMSSFKQQFQISASNEVNKMLDEEGI
eukprot:CAMPEP_0196586504 /NCGR_PEP_ID=MMETSP1081-20130531/54529_1 /TAXON_ID=36882 /ORGANISM="Pyramimonas amylifera, Strain CCMP720" /LENGTH=143 /DNA_ID=CAMNT_0041908411 /DNA_START=308 /DNA_END=739 /DNA_ORIENTATION=-